MKIRDCISNAKKTYYSGNYTEAIHEFEDIVKKSPECEECYFYLGLCYENINYEIKAIEYYKKGLELCDEEKYISDYHLNIGKNLLMLSRLNEALFHFDKSLEFGENRLLAFHNKATVYLCQKKYKKALELLDIITDEGLNNERINQNKEYCRNKLVTQRNGSVGSLPLVTSIGRIEGE